MAEVTRVFGIAGPHATVHEEMPDKPRLSRCGVRPQFRHYSSASDLRPVNCVKCLRLATKGQRRAWRS